MNPSMGAGAWQEQSLAVVFFYGGRGKGEGLGKGAKAVFREENMKTYIFQLCLTAKSHREWHSTENSTITYEDATFITNASYMESLQRCGFPPSSIRVRYCGNAACSPRWSHAMSICPIGLKIPGQNGFTCPHWPVGSLPSHQRWLLLMMSAEEGRILLLLLLSG